MANKYMKKCSTSLFTKEMQIKITLRIHLTLVIMVIIKKINNNKFGKDAEWQGRQREEALIHSWWECKLVQPLWKAVWKFFIKLKIELPYDPVIPFLCT
jgi:hypothetical protein